MFKKRIVELNLIFSIKVFRCTNLQKKVLLLVRNLDIDEFR